MVAPGLYLARVAVDTDLGSFEQTRTISLSPIERVRPFVER